MKEAILEALAFAHGEERRFVASLSPADRDAAGSPTAWSAKDVVAHLAAWKRDTAAILDAAARGEVRPYPDIAAFNAATFEAHRSHPWSEVEREMDESHAALVQSTRTCPDPALADGGRASDGKPLWKLALGDGCEHPIGHLSRWHLKRKDVARAAELRASLLTLIERRFPGTDHHAYGLVQLAGTDAQAGRVDAAIARLIQAASLDPEMLAGIETKAELEPLRGEPGYKVFVADLGALRDLYRSLLDAWNHHDARAYAARMDEDAHVVGFDGSLMDGKAAIESELARIFADHATGRYVAILRGIQTLAPSVALVRASAGLVPAGQQELRPELNAIQTLVARKRGDTWRIALFQNTPAAFHGRPELSRDLTRALRRVLADSSKPE